MEKDPLKSWHVTEEDWEHHRQYDGYLLAVEEMLERTETEWGPWTIVEATNRWYARVKIFNTLINALEERIGPVEELSEVPVVEPESAEEEAEVAAAA